MSQLFPFGFITESMKKNNHCQFEKNVTWVGRVPSLRRNRLHSWALAVGLAALLLPTGCQTTRTTTQDASPISLNQLQDFQSAKPEGDNNTNKQVGVSQPKADDHRFPAGGNQTGSGPSTSGLDRNSISVFRGQNYDPPSTIGGQDGPNGYPTRPVRPSGTQGTRNVKQVAFQDPSYPAPTVENPGYYNSPVPPPQGAGSPLAPQNGTFGNNGYPPNTNGSGYPPGAGQLGLGQPWITPPGIQNGNVADLDIYVREGQTGQFMIGAGVNSSAGLTGQLTISERNFDLFRFPRSFRDITSGEAFRGRGQSFRLEALPGTQLQRYLVSFGEPYFYLFGQPFSFNTSGYYFTRGYFDWNEQRIGGTMSLGYRLTQDLSLSLSMRGEQVKIFDPRLATSPELNAVVGDNEIYTLTAAFTHDTRDHPFLSSQGHYLSVSYQQAFGNFEYPRGDIEFRKYWLLTMRPDGSGKQTFSHSTKVGISGSQTPVFENYFAGGFSTIRGFDFRGASPVENGVIVGGEFQFLNTAEYTFPITNDDMFKGVLFCDYGTVERSVEINGDNFRVVPGFGFRINLPVGGAGGAPLAFDFGFPVSSAPTDDKRVFSFYMAVLR